MNLKQLCCNSVQTEKKSFKISTYLCIDEFVKQEANMISSNYGEILLSNLSSFFVSKWQKYLTTFSINQHNFWILKDHFWWLSREKNSVETFQGLKVFCRFSISSLFLQAKQNGVPSPWIAPSSVQSIQQEPKLTASL